MAGLSMPLRELLKSSSSELQHEMQFILNAVVEGICGVDSSGNTTFCNDVFLRMSGYDAGAVMGSNLHALVHCNRTDVAKRAEEDCPLRKALESRHRARVIREYLWKRDGTCLAVEYRANPVPQPSTSTTCVLTIHDVTDRERAAAAMRSSDERFQQISNNIDEAFYLVDVIASRLIYASPAFETITGHNCQEVCEKPSPWREFAVPEHRELVAADYRRLVAGEETRSEYQIRHRDGSIRWIKDHAKPIRDASGCVCMFAGVAEDITDIHEARESLHKSEERFRRILSSVAEVAWTSDEHRRTIYISPKVESVLGYTKEEICAAGASLRSGLIHPEDFGRINQSYRALFEKRSAFDEEYRIRRKDGIWIWIHDRSTGVHEENGVLYADGVFSDITRRKHAEAELQWKTAFLEAQTNSTIDGILVVDGKGKKLLHNQRFVELFKISAAIVAEADDRITLAHVISLVRDPERFIAKVKRLYGHPDETSRDEIEFKDGRVVDRYSAPVVDKNGRYYGRIWNFRDITERRELETQLRQAQKLEGIGQLAAGIAHEINTPTQFVTDNLTFLRDSWNTMDKLLELYRGEIRGAANLLSPQVAAKLAEAERNLDLEFIVAEVPRAIDQSLDGARRVAKIVRAMKEFSHPDSAEKTNTDLNKAIESTITVARNEWKYVADLATEFDETLPMVLCYPGDINQVVLNLLVNAAHAIKDKAKDGEKGSITVRTKARGEIAEISVSDTGTGIPEAIRTRIFDPFFTTKEVGKGTGQGLSLAHTLVVKKHSGKIWFETEVGKGTTFFIHLPINPTRRAK
jgi:PAS domain S-box-containing protein